jgi:hypothetical protein
MKVALTRKHGHNAHNINLLFGQLCCSWETRLLVILGWLPRGSALAIAHLAAKDSRPARYTGQLNKPQPAGGHASRSPL